MANWVNLPGMIGQSASREVFIGFAQGGILHSISFADVLDEVKETGYQRRFSKQHSLDFKRYICSETATTIPLTFNLRPKKNTCWDLKRLKTGYATLRVDLDCENVLAQVDCQHRMGFLTDSSIILPFMSFIGLSIREEMEVFNVINSKAKGLNASLLDFHASILTEDLGKERPELLIALYLHRQSSSPWHNQLDLGGNPTSGMTRKASLRTMQTAVKRFLSQSKLLETASVEEACTVVHDFWGAISIVLKEAWELPRKHMLTKGIGVYALMGLAGDLVKEANCNLSQCDEEHFCAHLSDFIHTIDWSNQGPLNGLGGQSGVTEALKIIRKARSRSLFKIV